MTTEVWKKIPDFDNYMVSNKERLKTISTNKIKDLTKLNKRGTVSLMKDNKQRHILFNRAVALTFIPNPDNLPIVTHINGRSNTPENLKWSKKGEESKKGIKKKDMNCVPILRLDDKGNTLEKYKNRKDVIDWIRKNCKTNGEDETIMRNIRAACSGIADTSHRYKWKYEFIEIEGEEWKKHPDKMFDNYHFSNMGRCRRSNRLILGSEKEGYISISSNGLHKLHRLIAQTFIPNPDNLPQVDHINENKSDNRVCNLRWCTNAQNAGYAKNKKIYQYSKDRKTFIKEFESIEKASEELNIIRCCIGECANNKIKSASGFWWSFTKI